MESRIIFMGTPQIAADVLKALLDAKANVSLVVTQPDRKVGRKQVITPCEVKKLALEHGIDVFQPEKIRLDYDRIVEENADLIITCAYGQIVPEAVLNAPAFGCVNLHGSLLPAYRGSAPIQRAIWDGLEKSGMSLMQMEKGMDTGGVMDIEEIAIDPRDNTTTLFDKMGQAAARLIIRNLETLLKGEAHFVPQNEEEATYAPKISKEQEQIDFSKPDQQILNQIRALSKAPGAWMPVEGKKLKILDAELLDEPSIGLGKVDHHGKKGLKMGLHEKNLLFKEVQPEGKPVMNDTAFKNGQGRKLIGQILDLVN